VTSEPVIRFSHRYLKFPPKVEENTYILSDMHVCDRAELWPSFVDYDTIYFAGNGYRRYPLPRGKVIVLGFVRGPGVREEYPPRKITDDKWMRVLFTTVRRWTEWKEKYYRSHLGDVFRVEITKEG